MWLTVTKSNNHPEIIASFYLNCVAGSEGCPVKLRTDCGTENSVRAALQCKIYIRYMKIHIFALRWTDEIRRSSQLRTLLKRVVVNRT